MDETFTPAWWLPGGHAQTVWATLMRRRVKLALRRERLELPDGDFLDLDWTTGTSGPIVILLHGLEGSIESGYARGLLRTFHERGWRGVLMHFRGCSGEPNRLARSYNAGDTADIATLAEVIRAREPDTPLAAVGVSIGGSVLLNWLGRSDQQLLSAAAAVSVPFVLQDAAYRLDRGLSRIYQWRLLVQLRQSVQRKFKNKDAPFSLQTLGELRNFRQFDDIVTAPLHGFSGVDDYYSRCSCRPILKNIEIPTLVIHAANDPFMTPKAIPHIGELSKSVRLEVSRSGGHVGFVTGSGPWAARYWLEQRIPAFLQNTFAHK